MRAHKRQRLCGGGSVKDSPTPCMPRGVQRGDSADFPELPDSHAALHRHSDSAEPRAGHRGDPVSRDTRPGETETQQWQKPKSKKQQRVSVTINRQNGQQRPDIDSLHQFLRWLVWQKFSAGGCAGRRAGREAPSGQPPGTPARQSAEKCPPWLRLTQPHLVGAVLVVVLPYLDLAALRMLQLESTDRVAELLQQVAARRRERWRSEPAAETDQGTEKSHATAFQSSEHAGNEESPPPLLGGAGSSGDGGEANACANSGRGRPRTTEGESGNADGEQRFADDVQRRNSSILPKGVPSLFKLMAAPSGPKVPTRFIRVESGQRCSIVTVRQLQETCEISTELRDETSSGVGFAPGWGFARPPCIWWSGGMTYPNGLRRPRPHYDPSYYLLTYDEMKQNEFPLPDEISGSLPAGYVSLHSELVYPAVCESRPSSWVAGESGFLSCPFALSETLPSPGFPLCSTSSSAPPVSLDLFFGLDCEMVLTSLGTEVGRVSVVNSNEEKLLDIFVRPEAPVIDYLTRFSGIEEHHLASAEHSLKAVHGLLRQILPHGAVLVGHSLENDLHALKLVHLRCVDTSILYPHAIVGLKNSLKHLVSSFLPQYRLRREAGHDSLEDARATLKLAKLKVQKGPGFGVVFRQYEPLGLALAAVASKAVHSQQTPGEGAHCPSANPKARSASPVYSPVLNCRHVGADAILLDETSGGSSGGTRAPTEPASHATASDPQTHGIAGDRSQTTHSPGVSSATGSPLRHSGDRAAVDTVRTSDAGFCGSARPEDSKLDVFLVDSFAHGCLEAFAGSHVFTVRDDDDAVKACLELLNASRARRLSSAPSNINATEGRGASLEASRSHMSEGDRCYDAVRPRPAGPQSPTAIAGRGQTAEDNGGGAAAYPSTKLGPVPFLRLRGRERAAKETDSSGARVRASSDGGNDEREDRRRRPPVSSEPESSLSIGVCVLRSYQRLCSQAAGVSRNHLYAFNRRVQRILHQTRGRKDEHPVDCDYRVSSANGIIKTGTASHAAYTPTQTRAGNAHKGGRLRALAEGTAHVKEEANSDAAGCSAVKHCRQHTGADERTSGVAGERRVSGEEEHANTDSKDTSSTSVGAFTGNAELIFPPVERRAALSTILELDDLILTLLAGMCHNDLLILLSPCGNAARYLSLAALRAALSSNCKGTHYVPAERKGRPQEVLGVNSRSYEKERASLLRCETGTDESQHEEAMLPRRGDTGVCRDVNAVELRGLGETPQPLDVGSYRGTLSSVATLKEESSDQLKWSSSMERALEKARGEFQGPVGGPWVGFFVRPAGSGVIGNI
ncbi:hypothetical protein BESB_036350 [Besnoitia besnoiti]|uniref:Exonuclease domain-containing protein n=1 Tax=Besnoitia besnoiti TaxID=94643 RepID=A0A2A9MMZ1_BESBE|nr:hypothetical protein BESB_036350 [Besnoitia besnoiti]PFH37177.1 hypothetical protein BESB_036350 [Besnoitia besnoiti]